MPCIPTSESYGQRNDLLGNAPIFASPDVFFRVISESSQHAHHKSPLNGANKPDTQRAHSLHASRHAWQPQPARLERWRTYDVSKPLPHLPCDSHGNPRPTSEHLAMINEIAGGIEPLTISIRSNLYDAKRGALARLSLPLPMEVDPSVANYCKGLHSEFSPLPALSPSDSFFLGKQIDARCSQVLEAVATHFLTLSLRGIFDFVKDDIIASVRDDVLQFVVERVGVLLVDEDPVTEIKVALVRTASQTEALLDGGLKRKSYCEWEKERKKTRSKEGRLGTGEYLEDMLDEVIGDIVSYFRVAMLTRYRYGEVNPTALAKSTGSFASERKALSNDSPLEKVQKATINAMWPALHGVKIGDTSVVPLEELVLFPIERRGDGPTVRTSPVKKPKVSRSDEHTAESVTYHDYQNNAARELEADHKHGRPNLQDAQCTSTRVRVATGSITKDRPPLRASPERKPEMVQPSVHVEQTAIVHDGRQIRFTAPKDYHQDGGHRAPSSFVRADPVQHNTQHVSFVTPADRHKHGQPERRRLASPFVPKSQMQPHCVTSQKTQVTPEISKRPLFGRSLDNLHDQHEPHHRACSDTLPQHPQSTPTALRRQSSNSIPSPIGFKSNSSIDAPSPTGFASHKGPKDGSLGEESLSRTQRSPIQGCLQAGPGASNFKTPEKMHSPRVGALLRRLPPLKTKWVFADEESISKDYVFSEAASSSHLPVIRESKPTASDGGEAEEDDDEEDIWLEAARGGSLASTAVNEADSIDDLKVRVQKFMTG